MRKSRFTEAQIIGIIKEQEAGLSQPTLPLVRSMSPLEAAQIKGPIETYRCTLETCDLEVRVAAQGAGAAGPFETAWQSWKPGAGRLRTAPV